MAQLTKPKEDNNSDKEAKAFLVRYLKNCLVRKAPLKEYLKLLGTKNNYLAKKVAIIRIGIYKTIKELLSYKRRATNNDFSSFTKRNIKELPIYYRKSLKEYYKQTQSMLVTFV